MKNHFYPTNIRNYISRLILGSILIIASINITGCKKFIEIDAPITSTNADIVYSDNARAAAVMTGLLGQMSQSNLTTNGGFGSISVVTELSSDNLSMFGTSNKQYTRYFQNNLNSKDDDGSSFYHGLYPMIYTTNAAIEGLTKSQTLSSGVKQRLLGESHFFRAFFYFYLVNLYGDVPLIVSTDYKVSSLSPRTPSSTIYTQIILDINIAINSMDDNYLNSNFTSVTAERVRPNRQAAYALLARVQLFNKHYAEAEAAASQVINQSALYSLNIPLNTVFQKNSKETIWALQPINSSYNTKEGDLFMLPPSGPNSSIRPLYASRSLINSFETNDQRKVFWTDSVTANGVTYPFVTKYKVIANTGSIKEYLIVLRLAEQYLIRAEARNEQGNTSGALSDLNMIRNRAGLPSTSNSTQSVLRDEILRERRSELFTEWGNRWLDLRRVGKIDAIMQSAAILKNGSWSSYDALFPIPLTELNYDPNLRQNPGY
jgi:hypothetical protein